MSFHELQFDHLSVFTALCHGDIGLKVLTFSELRCLEVIVMTDGQTESYANAPNESEKTLFRSIHLI